MNRAPWPPALAPAPPPQRETPKHACFSGSPVCSGCNPCPACREHVQSRVLPVAIVGSRMNEILLTLHTLMGALIERGVDLRSLGVDFSSVFPTLEEQGEVFFQAVNDGWKRMFDEMNTDTALQQRIRLQDPIGSAPAPAGPAPSPEQTVARDPDELPPYEDFAPLAAVQTVHVTRMSPAPVSPPAASALATTTTPPVPRPFDAEEIALAGVPLPEGAAR